MSTSDAAPIRVGLIGDHDATVTAHQAIPRALALAGEALGLPVTPEWIATDTIPGDAPAADRLAGFDALWCVPASPYRSTDGALAAIRHARERGVPFLGTCGGFQHAVLEYARTVVGWRHAAHAEVEPAAELAVVTPLACSLVEVRDAVHLVPGSRLAAAYGAAVAEEGYHCRYGLNPAVRAALVAHGLRVAATDAAGEVRAVELPAHPFYVATLFQPERAALRGVVPPLIHAFVAAANEAGPRRRPATRSRRSRRSA